jgi:ribosomal protein L32
MVQGAVMWLHGSQSLVLSHVRATEVAFPAWIPDSNGLSSVPSWPSQVATSMLPPRGVQAITPDSSDLIMPTSNNTTLGSTQCLPVGMNHRGALCQEVASNVRRKYLTKEWRTICHRLASPWSSWLVGYSVSSKCGKAEFTHHHCPHVVIAPANEKFERSLVQYVLVFALSPEY